MVRLHLDGDAANNIPAFYELEKVENGAWRAGNSNLRKRWNEWVKVMNVVADEVVELSQTRSGQGAPTPSQCKDMWYEAAAKLDEKRGEVKLPTYVKKLNSLIAAANKEKARATDVDQ